MLTRNRYASFRGYLTSAYIVSEGSAAVGVVAAFWHVSWIAGLLIVVSGLVGVGIYLAYSRQLQKDDPSKGKEPGE